MIFIEKMRKFFNRKPLLSDNQAKFSDKENIMQKQIAVFIDAENGTLPLLDELFIRLKPFGKIRLARAYGDFSQPNLDLENWKKVCFTHNISIFHHFTCRKQKNSSDIFLSIDVMDILYQQPEIDLFCLVSSDSDFSTLIQRLKNAGKMVIGAGSVQPNAEYQKLCDEFFYIRSIEKEPVIQPTSEELNLSFWQKSLAHLEQLKQQVEQFIKPPAVIIDVEPKKLIQPSTVSVLNEEQKLIKTAYQKCQAHLIKGGYVAFSRYQSHLPQEARANLKKQYKSIKKWVEQSAYFEITYIANKTEPYLKPKF